MSDAAPATEQTSTTSRTASKSETTGPDTSNRISRIAGALWSRGSSAPALAAMLTAFIFVIQTWPWLIHMSHWGIAAPGDGLGGTALWQAMAHEHLNPFTPGRMSVFNAPFGLPITWQVNIQQWPTTAIMYFLTWISGDNGEFAFTVYVAMGLTLTAASMAWLAERLTKDRTVAVIIGIGLTLAPFIELSRSGHPAFVHDWTIAATVGAIWVLYERPSPWRAFAVGVLGFVAMSWSGYQLLFVAFSMVVVMGGFMLAALRTPTRSRNARDFSIVLGLMLGGVIAQYGAIFLLGHGANPASSLRNFGREALIIYGARWYEYLIPDSHSILFGADTRSFFASHLHGSNPAEATLYLGLSVGALVVCGLVAAWRGQLRSGSRLPFAVCGLLLFVAGVWASLPLGAGTGRLGVNLPTLAGFVGDITGNWRVFSRFVLVALVGWFLMAAGGLAWIARGRGIRRGAILVFAAAAIAIDLYYPGVNGPLDIGTLQIAASIRHLPPGAMAQYPLAPEAIDGYTPLFNQPLYGRALLNGFEEQPQSTLDSQLQDLSLASTARTLGLLKIRYVLDVAQPLPGVTLSTHVSRLLRPILSGMYGPWSAEVYEVPPQNSDAVVAELGAGFSSLERVGTNSWQWMTGDEGKITFLSNCSAQCRGHLDVELAALGPARNVTFRTQNGRQLAHLDLSSQRLVTIPVDPYHTKSITVRATPGPIPISRVEPGSSDPRSVSIQVINMRWVPAPSRHS